ncbi:MAG: HAD family phosphatase [Propionibacteriales bacterium]|nr:HAD family phosphatase [Propionibacteriales bacterium]
MSDLQAVLFDMDGTICDTESEWMAAEFALARRYGAEWTSDDGLLLVGNDLLASGAYIQRRMGLPLSAEQIVEELVDAVLSSVATRGVQWRPGALELLVECNDAGLPTALVTMSYRRLAEAVLAVMPLGRFDVVVTGDEVISGKPAPDSYLLAAELLSVEASGCLVIEDSPAGAAAGEAAGCLVLAVPHNVDVPAGPRRRFLPSLLGVSLEQLRLLLVQR